MDPDQPAAEPGVPAAPPAGPAADAAPAGVDAEVASPAASKDGSPESAFPAARETAAIERGSNIAVVTVGPGLGQPPTLALTEACDLQAVLVTIPLPPPEPPPTPAPSEMPAPSALTVAVV